MYVKMTHSGLHGVMFVLEGTLSEVIRNLTNMQLTYQVERADYASYKQSRQPQTDNNAS